MINIIFLIYYTIEKFDIIVKKYLRRENKNQKLISLSKRNVISKYNAYFQNKIKFNIFLRFKIFYKCFEFF